MKGVTVMYARLFESENSSKARLSMIQGNEQV